MGGKTRNWKQERIQEQRCKSESGMGAEAREARKANAKCKGKKLPLLRLLDL
jgi:hypothetical protein